MATICGVGRLGREWADGHPEAEPGSLEHDDAVPRCIACVSQRGFGGLQSLYWVLGGAKGEAHREERSGFAPQALRGGAISLSFPSLAKPKLLPGLRVYVVITGIDFYKPQIPVRHEVWFWPSFFSLLAGLLVLAGKGSMRGRCNVGDGGRIGVTEVHASAARDHWLGRPAQGCSLAALAQPARMTAAKTLKGGPAAI